MIIYGIDNNFLLDAVLTESAQHEQELMKSNFVKLSWFSDVKLSIPVGAYIIPFADNIRYRLIEPYTPVSEDEGKFKYEPEFQHPIMWLGKVPFTHKMKNVLSEYVNQQEWEYTGLTITLLQYVVDAVNNAFGFESDADRFTFSVIGEVDSTVSLQFSSVDILSAVSIIANACENCEWHLDWENRTLYFGQISIDHGEDTTPLLKVGDNIGKASVTSPNDGYYNVFYPQGSTRNMSVRSASGENVSTGIRLGLDKTKYPEGVIDTRTDKKEPQQTLGILYNDIYPHVDLYAYNIRRLTRDLLNDTTKEKVVDHYNENGEPVYRKYSIWFMRLAYPTYDEQGKITAWTDYAIEKKQILDGYTLSGTFKANTHTDENGKIDALPSSLAGQPSSGDGFEMYYHDVEPHITLDDGSKVQVGDYEIKFVKQGDNDMIVPTTEDAGLIPRGEKTPSLKGNIVVLYNIKMGDNEVISAQQDLEKAVLKDIQRKKSDRNNYSFSSYAHVFEKSDPKLYIGRSVTYDDGNGYTLSTRVIKLVKKLDFDFIQEITVGNQQIKGSTSQLKEDVKLIMSGNFEGAGLNATQVRNLIRNYSDSRFLRKDTPDTALEHIRFEKGLSTGFGDNGITAEGDARLRQAVLEGVSSSDSKAGLMDGQGFSLGMDQQGKSLLEIDKLIVRMKMIIQELEVRKMSYVGGDQVHSSAGSLLSSVRKLPSGDYRCYVLADDGSTRTMNDWRIGDQARCQTFNIMAGAYQNVANRYYWRLVINRGEEWLVGGVPRRKIGSFKIGAHGVTTYTLPEDAYFSGKDIDGFTALVIDSVRYNPENIGNSVINEKVITGFVAKGTGIILKAEAGEYDVFTYDIPHENTVYDNWLRGIEEPVTLEGYSTDGVINLVLVVKDGKGIWAYVNKQRVMSAGRAYISVTLGQATFANNVASTVEQKLYNFIDLSDTRGSLEITGEDGQTYTCVGYDTSVENDAPLAEDDVAQLGSQTDKDRQYAYIIYVSEQMRVDYAGINDFDLASHAVEKHSAKGGFVHSDRFEIRSASGTGVSAPIVCDRGEWLSGMICGHYDRVSHNGSLWLCNAGKGRTTTEEPSEISTVWIRQVEKGAQGESRVTVELTTSDGDRAVLYREGQGLLTTMIATVYKGDKVITPEIHPSQLVWKRKTEAGGTDDEDWNARHTNTDFTMPVTFADLVPPKTRFMAILYDEHGIESTQDIIEY